MATLVQATAALNLASTDPTVQSYGINVVSGNYLYALMAVVGTATVSGVTSTRSAAFVKKGQYTTAGGNLEIWRAVATSSGACTVTVDMSALPTGGSTLVMCEIAHAGAPSDGPSNTLAAGAAADPLVMATLTTTAGGIIFSFARLTSNFGVTSIGDGFSFLHSGSTLGRGLFIHRTTSSGVSAAPTVDMTNTESADSLTIAFYDAAPKTAFVFGRDGSVQSDMTVHDNLDGVTRTVNLPGSHSIGGNLALIEQSSGPSGTANTGKLYTEDNGAGKTRLMIQFGTGAAIQLAVEP